MYAQCVYVCVCVCARARVWGGGLRAADNGDEGSTEVAKIAAEFDLQVALRALSCTCGGFRACARGLGRRRQFLIPVVAGQCCETSTPGGRRGETRSMRVAQLTAPCTAFLGHFPGYRLCNSRRGGN
jgi:hypothetical protein